jgi:hypothetical protein
MITGKDLIELGLKPNKRFKEAIISNKSHITFCSLVLVAQFKTIADKYKQIIKTIRVFSDTKRTATSSRLLLCEVVGF